ncbi:uncharacterized protein K444DRAFT_532041, partial [Hyaloscypha bicolor E]
IFYYILLYFIIFYYILLYFIIFINKNIYRFKAFIDFLNKFYSIYINNILVYLLELRKKYYKYI